MMDKKDSGDKGGECIKAQNDSKSESAHFTHMRKKFKKK